MTVRLRASAAAAMLVIVLGGCTRHEERYLTPWLKVDISRPVTGTSGVVVLGSREEVFDAKVGGRWVRLGVGHGSSYMVLADDQAVLIDLHNGKGLQLVRGDASPRLVPQAFGRNGNVAVTPDREAIDVFECRIHATPAGCREVEIYRYDVAGTLLASFPVALPEAYSDCQQLRIAGYDQQRIPYVFAQCRMDSVQAKCVVVAPRKDALFVYAVGADQPWIECSEFSRAGVSLTEPQNFMVMS
jgi:hypothetical protein